MKIFNKIIFFTTTTFLILIGTSLSLLQANKTSPINIPLDKSINKKTRKISIPLKTPLLEELLEEAVKARKNAYSPYSKFRVGAAILLDNGKIFRGANIENASYGLTICAERSAICAANVEQKEPIKIIAIAVISDKEEKPILPCGACLQVIAEFVQHENIPIVLAKANKEYQIKTFAELFPNVFTFKGPNN